MTKSYCLCNKISNFKTIIAYKNEAVFKNFEGIRINRCLKCGLLKTITAKNNHQPQQSRYQMYESKRRLFSKLFLPIVNKIIKIKETGNVLDVGCSSGLLIEILKNKGLKVCGIEPDYKAYYYAKQKLGRNIFFGTIENFIKKNQQKFDVIIFNHVLEHIEKADDQLKIARKLLKKKGLLVVGIPNTRNLIFFVRGKFWEPLMPKEHIWHFSDKYMINLIKLNGFSIDSVEYSDDKRQDYLFLKRLYFNFLSLLNKLFLTGESVTIYAIAD